MDEFEEQARQQVEAAGLNYDAYLTAGKAWSEYRRAFHHGDDAPPRDTFPSALSYAIHAYINADKE